MVEKTEDKRKKEPFSDSSEIFESIFKEATQEIEKETGKGAKKPELKSKAKVKAKPEVRPKPPIKLELEPKEEPEQKPRSEGRSEPQSIAFKSRQDAIRKPFTRTQPPSEEARGVVPVEPLERSVLKAQEPKAEPSVKAEKPKPFKKKEKGSPVLRIVLLLVLLAVGLGGASVYLGIIDLNDFLGGPEPAPKEAPKIAATKTPPARTVAKPPQPAPKAAQPTEPQAKPAEAPKPTPPPQPVQPAQPPTKPAEPVTPPPAREAQAAASKLETPVEPGKAASSTVPPQPQDVQAKQEPSAPVAVVKAETPPPPIQSPVKVEPPPAPVQPPVKIQPQAPPPSPPVQPQVKSETRAASAPVQPPAVPKKDETPQTRSQPKQVAVAQDVTPVSGTGVAYPYSVYLGSVQSMDYVKKAMSSYEGQGLSTYWAKVDLGAKGTWYRLFTGYFRNAQEAEAFIHQKRIKDAEVKETKYSTLIGTFVTRQDGEEKIRALANMGVSAYWIQAGDDQVRLYSGAFITKDGAEKNQAELNAKGIKGEIVER